MTKQEFLTKLSEIGGGWYLDSHRAIRIRIDCKLNCPISAVVTKVCGIYNGYYSPEFEGIRRLGLDSQLVRDIIVAADYNNKSELRQELLQICKLQ